MPDPQTVVHDPQLGNLLQQSSQADSKESYITLYPLVLPQARSVHRYFSQRKLFLKSKMLTAPFTARDISEGCFMP